MFLTLAMFFVPTFALIAGMMITIGSMVTETRQGQQIAGALNMLFTLPFFFIVVFFTAPNSTLATILTIFPDDVVSHHCAALEHDDDSHVGDDRRLDAGDRLGGRHDVGGVAHVPHGHAALRSAPGCEDGGARRCAPGRKG